MSTLFILATLEIYKIFNNYSERKLAEQIADIAQLMNYNQETFIQPQKKFLVTESHRMASRTRSSITFYFPTLPSSRQRMPSDGMSQFHTVGAAFAFSHRIKFNCMRTWFTAAIDR
jgi:hypothetical protein